MTAARQQADWLRQPRPVTSSRPHFSSGRRFQSVKPPLCSHLEMAHRRAGGRGPNAGTEGNLRLFQKPPSVRPHPASLDRGGGQGVGAHLLPAVAARVRGPICSQRSRGHRAQLWHRPDRRSPGSLHRSWASGPGPEAHTDAVPALLDALRSGQLAHSVLRNQPVASWPGRGWGALGQGVGSEASPAALYAGLAWGCGPARGAAGHQGGCSAWTSLLEEGPAALPSPGPACPEQTGAGLTLGVSRPSGRQPAGLCSGTGLARCLRACGPQPGVGPLIPWGPSSQGEAMA